MTGAGFIPGYGWAISGAYFLGKYGLEKNQLKRRGSCSNEKGLLYYTTSIYLHLYVLFPVLCMCMVLSLLGWGPEKMEWAVVLYGQP